MDSAKWRSLAKGIGFSVFYFLAYLTAWLNSLDQWFLPAGVRAASMLFLPYRYWPYLFLGDAAALLAIRIPTSWQFGDFWAPVSALLLAPMISLVPISFRKHLKSIHENVIWLPLIALCFAAWSSLCNLILNFSLSGPKASGTPDIFLRYITGDALGFLMVVPLALVWLRRKTDEYSPKKFSVDVAIAVTMVAVMYGATLPPTIGPALKQLLLIMMLLPAVALTVLHGWRGAAIGTSTTNIAIALSLPDFGFYRAHDETAFLAQQILAVLSIALLLFGAKISKLFVKAKKLGVSEQQALELAQTSFLSPEHKFREKVLYMAQMQIALDEQRRSIAAELKNLGHYQAAMDLNTHGVEQKARFEQHVMALYPPQIEQDGLFSALHTDAVMRFWAGDAEVILMTKYSAKRLSNSLQYSAYYCIGNAIAFLSQFNPDCYEIRARVWATNGRRGIAVIVSAKPTTEAQPNDASILAIIELQGRTKAYGGAVKRRHTHQISMLLSEKDLPHGSHAHQFDHITP